MKDRFTSRDSRPWVRRLSYRWVLLSSLLVLLLGGLARPVAAQTGDEFWFDVPEHVRSRHDFYPVFLHVQNLTHSRVKVRLELPAEPWNATAGTGFEPITFVIRPDEVRKIQLGGKGGGTPWKPNGVPRDLGEDGGNVDYWSTDGLCLHYRNYTNDEVGDCKEEDRAKYIENQLSWAESDVSKPEKMYINRTNKGVKMTATVEETAGSGEYKQIAGARLISAYLEMGMKNSYDILVLKGANALGQRFVVPAQSSIGLAGSGASSARPAPVYSSVNVVANRGNMWVDVYSKRALFAKEKGVNKYGGTKVEGDIVNGKHHYRLYFARPGQSMILAAYAERTRSDGTKDCYQVPTAADDGLAGMVIEVVGREKNGLDAGQVAVTLHSDDATPGSNGPDYIADQLVPVSRYGRNYAAMRGIMETSKVIGEVLAVVAESATNVTAYYGVKGAGNTFESHGVVPGWDGRPLAAGEQAEIKIDGYSAVTLVAPKEKGKFGVFQVSGLLQAYGQRAGAILPPVPVGQECIGTREVVLTRPQQTYPLYVNVLAFEPDGVGTQSSAIGGFKLEEFNGTAFVEVTSGKGKEFVDKLNEESNWTVLPYEGTNVALGRWKWMQVQMSNDNASASEYFPEANRAYRLSNGQNVFQIGVLHGSGYKNAEFGYFSDFTDLSKGLPVQDNSPALSSSYMVTPEGLRICHPTLKDVKLAAEVKGALSYDWHMYEVDKSGNETDLTGGLSGADTKEVTFTAPAPNDPTKPDEAKSYYLTFKAKGFCNNGAERRIPLVVGHDVGKPSFTVDKFCSPYDGNPAPLAVEVSNVMHADSIRWEVSEPFGIPAGGTAGLGHTSGAQGKMDKPVGDDVATVEIPLLFNKGVFDSWQNSNTKYQVHLSMTAFNAGCANSTKDEDVDVKLAPSQPVVSFKDKNGAALVMPVCPQPGEEAKAEAVHDLNGLSPVHYTWTIGTTTLTEDVPPANTELLPGVKKTMKVSARTGDCTVTSDTVSLLVGDEFAFPAGGAGWTPPIPALSEKRLANELVQAEVKGLISQYKWVLRKEGGTGPVKELSGKDEKSFELKDGATGGALGLGKYTLTLTVSSKCGADLEKTQTFRIVDKLVPVGFEDGKIAVENYGPDGSSSAEPVADGSSEPVGDEVSVWPAGGGTSLPAGRKVKVHGASEVRVDAETGLGRYRIVGPDKVDIVVGRKVEIPAGVLPVGVDAKDGDGHTIEDGDPVKDGGTLVLPQQKGDYPIEVEGENVTGPTVDAAGNNVWTIGASDKPVKVRFKRVAIDYEPTKVSVKDEDNREVATAAPAGGENGKRELGKKITVSKKAGLADGEVARVKHASPVGTIASDGTGEYLLNEDATVKVETGFPVENLENVPATSGSANIDDDTLLQKDAEITVPKRQNNQDVVVRGATGPVTNASGENVWTVEGNAPVVIVLVHKVNVAFDDGYSLVVNDTHGGRDVPNGSTVEESGDEITVSNGGTDIPIGKVRKVHGATPVAGKVNADNSGKYTIAGDVRIVVGRPVKVAADLGGKTMKDGDGAEAHEVVDGDPIADGGTLVVPAEDADGNPIVVDGASGPVYDPTTKTNKWTVSGDEPVRVHVKEVPVTYPTDKVWVKDADVKEVSEEASVDGSEIGKRAVGSVLDVSAKDLKPGAIVRPVDANSVETVGTIAANGAGAYKIKKDATGVEFETGFPVENDPVNGVEAEKKDGASTSLIGDDTLLQKGDVIVVPDVTADGKKVEVKGATPSVDPVTGEKTWTVDGDAPVEIVVHVAVPVYISGNVGVTNTTMHDVPVANGKKEALHDVLDVQPNGATDGRVVKVHGGRLVAESNADTHAGTYEVVGPDEVRVVFGRPVVVDGVSFPSGKTMKDGDGKPVGDKDPVKDGGTLVVPAEDADGNPIVVDGAVKDGSVDSDGKQKWTVSGDDPVRVHVKEVTVTYPGKVLVKDDASPAAEVGTGNKRKMGTLLTVSSNGLADGEIVRLKDAGSAEKVSVPADGNGTGTYRLSKDVDDVEFETGFPVENDKANKVSAEKVDGSSTSPIGDDTLLQAGDVIVVPDVTADGKKVEVKGATPSVDPVTGEKTWTVDGDAPVEIVVHDAVPVDFDKSLVTVGNETTGLAVAKGGKEAKGDVLVVAADPSKPVTAPRKIKVHGATADAGVKPNGEGKYTIDDDATEVRVVVGKPVEIPAGVLPTGGKVMDGDGVDANEVEDGDPVVDGGTLVVPAQTNEGYPIVVDNAKKDGPVDGDGNQKWTLEKNDEPVKIHVKRVKVEYAKAKVSVLDEESKEVADKAASSGGAAGEREIGTKITVGKTGLADGEVARVKNASPVGTIASDGTGEYLMDEDADVVIETGFPVANDDRVPATSTDASGTEFNVVDATLLQKDAEITVPKRHKNQDVVVRGATGPVTNASGENVWTVEGNAPVVIVLVHKVNVAFDDDYSLVVNDTHGGRDVPDGSKVEESGDEITVSNGGTDIPIGKVRKVHGAMPVAGKVKPDNSGEYAITGDVRIVVGRPVAIADGVLPVSTEVLDGDGKKVEDGFPVVDGGTLVVPAEKDGYPIVVDGATGPSYDPTTKTNTWVVTGDEPVKIHRKEVPVTYAEAKVSVKDADKQEVGTGKKRELGSVLDVTSVDLQPGEIVRPVDAASVEEVGTVAKNGVGAYRIAKGATAVEFEAGFPVMNADGVEATAVAMNGGSPSAPFDVDGKTLLQENDVITVPDMHNGKKVDVAGAVFIGDDGKGNKHWRVIGNEAVAIVVKESVPVTFEEKLVKVKNETTQQGVTNGHEEAKGDVLDVQAVLDASGVSMLKDGRIIKVHGGTEEPGVDPVTGAGKYLVVGPEKVRIVVGKPVAIADGVLPSGKDVVDGNKHVVGDKDPVKDEGTLVVPAETTDGYPIVVDNATSGAVDSDGNKTWTLKDNDDKVKVHVKEVAVNYTDAKVKVEDDKLTKVLDGGKREMGRKISVAGDDLAVGEVVRVENAKYVDNGLPRPEDGTGEYLLNVEADVEIRTGFPVANADGVDANTVASAGSPSQAVDANTLLQKDDVIAVPVKQGDSPVVVQGAVKDGLDADGNQRWKVRGDAPVVIVVQESIPVHSDGNLITVYDMTVDRTVPSGHEEVKGDKLDVQPVASLTDGRIIKVYGGEPVAGMVKKDKSGEYMMVGPDEVYIVVGKPVKIPEGMLADDAKVTDGASPAHEVKDGDPVADGGTLIVPAEDKFGNEIVVDGAEKDGPVGPDGKQKWVLKPGADAVLRSVAKAYDSPFHITVIGGTDVEAADVEPLSVYPNPTYGRVRVDGLAAGGMLEVYSVLGQRVMAIRLEADGMLDMGSLSRGVYVLKAGERVCRVVKM